MAEPFKTFINAEVVATAARHLARADARFDAAAFTAAVAPRLDALELKARAMLIADVLEEHLSPDFAVAAAHLERALATVSSSSEANDDGLRGWVLWSVGEYVARRGLDHPQRALACLRETTQRFTAEFAIRPFLQQHPAITFGVLHAWLDDPSEHVRRLVSEGTRPRLPWGMQLRELIRDPSPSLPLLERLMDDPSEYVRRSVANHLNDIAKDHPAIVTTWVERHLPGAPAARTALLRHASRTLVKRGHAPMLTAWGRGAALRGEASLSVTPKRIALGEAVTLAVTLRSTARAAQPLTVDYVVHHVKADGSTSPKVFKGWNLELAAGAEVTLTRRHSVRRITTRRYYRGRHRVVVQVNGQPVAEAHFDLRMPTEDG